MAVYPCDYAPHRYPDAQQSIYFTLIVGQLVDTMKQRLCPKHFRAQAVYLQEHFAMIDESSQVSDTCERCDAPRESAIYAKVFPAKSEMQQFALDLCATHLKQVGEELRVGNGSRLPDR